MIIGVFDSGIGGLTVLAEIKKLLPNEKYYYIKDSKNCPYGEKSLEELKKIVSSATERLIWRGAEIIVVACNTATTQTIDYLREKYPEVKFVWTEPAIKKGAEESSERAKIVVRATEGTARSERLRQMTVKYKKPGQEILTIPCSGLARAIEDKDEEKIEKILDGLEETAGGILTKTDGKMSEISSALKIMDFTEVETVILGCTHYPLIREKIQKKFPCARLIDGSEGVAREVKRLVSQACNK